MTIVYIIFTLICILLILGIIFGILLYKQIKERLNYYDDITEFIEFGDGVININKIQMITKTNLYINIYFSEDYLVSKRFNSEEECNKRYLDILDCISYYPKSY